MEPMNLGSPGSPSPIGGGAFLPSFLMGDQNTPSTPRSNTLSPSRGGRTQLAFGNTPRQMAAANASASAATMAAMGGGGSGLMSPPPAQQQPDFNRSAMSLLQPHGYPYGQQQQQQLQQHQHLSQQKQQQLQQQQQHQQQLNASISGPPKMGLFDSLKASETQVATGQQQQQQQPPNAANFSASANYSQLNQSYAAFNDSLQDPYAGDFNVSRLTSPVIGGGGGGGAYDFRSPTSYGNQQHQHQQHQQQPHYQLPLSSGGPGVDYLVSSSDAIDAAQPRQPIAPFWVTVFGFPAASRNAILAHFAQCGSVVDKVLPAAAGNWMHLRYSSRVECDKAVNFNERVLGESLMIGVVYCRDAEIVEREAASAAATAAGGGADQLAAKLAANGNNVPVNRVRPLAQSAYHNSLSPTEVVLSPTMPKRSTGLVNKAMDMIFGW